MGSNPVAVTETLDIAPVSSKEFLVFTVCPRRGLSRYIETKLQTVCFLPIRRFLKKQKDVWN